MDTVGVFDIVADVIRITSFNLERDRDQSYDNITVADYDWIQCDMQPKCCIVGVEKSLAVELAIGVFDIPRNSLTDDDIKDALKEMTNIITGRIQGVFFPNLEIGIPVAIEEPQLADILNRQFVLHEMVKINSSSLFVGVR